jgi:hypothetical protein
LPAPKKVAIIKNRQQKFAGAFKKLPWWFTLAFFSLLGGAKKAFSFISDVVDALASNAPILLWARFYLNPYNS